jgi:hypothetical protein
MGEDKRFETFRNPEMFGRVSDLPISPLQYYNLVRDFNKLIQGELADELGSHAEQLGAFVTLVTPGSDGRREKGSFASPLEIIALLEENIDPSVFRESLDSVLKKVSATRLYDVAEIKTPTSSSVFFNGNSQRVQPGRVAESRLLYGPPDVLEKAKRKLGEDIISMPRKKIIKKVNNLVQDARKITEHGQDRIRGVDAIHFDMENGTIFYNPKRTNFLLK